MGTDNPSIFVTRPYLPPLEEFMPYLEQIWSRRVLTNGGPFHQQLEAEMADYLGVSHLALVSNGTVGLMIALQALHITGEVITTPYSFAATAHSLLWNGATPVFVDIDKKTLNVDPHKIEAAITPRTTAILPVHCYGTPCDMNGIQSIADNFGLKVIYDAAHAFGVKLKRRSLVQHGDLSVLSFHATKVFNTFEGGAIICPDAKMKRRIDYLKNFGFADEVTVTAPGINGKMNEFQAALGLLQLKHVTDVIAQRRRVVERYRELLKETHGLRCLEEFAGVTQNYAYFPVFVGPEFRCSRDDLYRHLAQHNVFSRRYFYPLISSMPMYRGLASAAPANLPVANKVAQEVLCLPVYPDLSREDQQRIVDLIEGR